MPVYLRNTKPIRASLDHLLVNDCVFAASGLTHDHVTATRDDFDLPSLAQTIVGQQLSTKAAATIWGRVAAAIDIHDPQSYLAATHDELRALGLSSQKVKYFHGLAEAVRDDKLDFAALKRASNDDVIAALTSLKGFGVWSAQMMLIFALARPDVWPSGDLGVQEGLRMYRKLKERPDAKATEQYGLKKFGPHTSAAALLLWRLKDGPKKS